MLCALLDRARHRDMARATLEVRASNQSAISLYQKLGFQVAGRRKRYYTDTGEDALILWRGGLQSNEFATLLATRWAEIRHRLTEQHWALHLSPDLSTLEKSTLTYL
jgi:ribosomal-protein-alanine N-acetyltransferase